MGRLETRRASSTTWLSRNHGTLSEEGLEPRHRDGVLLVANRQAEKCVGSVNHPVWAVIQGCEGRTNPVTADEHVFRLPECRRKMHGSRGRRRSMDQRRWNEGIHEAVEVVQKLRRREFRTREKLSR